VTLRFLTYNIWDGGAAHLDQIASVIAPVDPDVVLLNEADDRNIAEQLALELGYDCLWARGSGTKHIALLTRLPVAYWRVHNRRPITQAVLEAELRLLDRPDGSPSSIIVFGVHLLPYFMLIPFEVARWRTLRSLLRHIKRTCTVPHLLFGDFNATLAGERADTSAFSGRIRRDLRLQANVQLHFALRQINRAGYTDCYRRLHPREDGLTWMTWMLGARLDYAFADPQMSGRLQRCEVITAPPAAQASDHFPLLAEFEF
jgi:exodeoxyribonuclease III